MKNNFWIEEKSPTQFFKEFILSENPQASFWDVFTHYEPEYLNDIANNKSSKDLQNQREIVDEIIQKYFSETKMNRQEIELLVDAIAEFLLPEKDQETANIYSKVKDIAQEIAKNHLQPLKLKQRDSDDFLDDLQDKLEEINQKYIRESDQEAIRQSIRLKGITGEYKPEEVADYLSRYETHWENQAIYLASAPKEEAEDIASDRDDFIYPRLPLACSTTFYDFNGDGGNLSYEEQETFVNQLFERYKNEISELLNQQPDASLQPHIDYKKLDKHEHLETLYWETIETNPFMYEYEVFFAAWKGNDKVMFLSVNHEDKELPYEINLGGLSLDKYEEILAKFNAITA